MGAPRLSDVGIVTLEITAETKTPADSDVQIDQVGFEPAPKGYSSVGGCHGSINKPGATTTDQSQAKIGVLHHGKCLVAASHGKEIRTAKEHGMIAKKKTAAPEEHVRSKDQWRAPGFDPIMEGRAPPHPLCACD